MAPFMPHDDHLSLTLALSINPKAYNSPSTRSLLHPNFNLNLVHTKKIIDISLGHNVIINEFQNPSWIFIISTTCF